MKTIINACIDFTLFLVGLFICYWAGKKWYETGFEFGSILRLKDGNGFFYLILIGLALVGNWILNAPIYFYQIKHKNSEE